MARDRDEPKRDESNSGHDEREETTSRSFWHHLRGRIHPHRWLLAATLVILIGTGAFFGLRPFLKVPYGGPPDGGTVPREGPQIIEEDHEAIDETHRQRVEAFPAETEGLGGQTLEPLRVEDGVKVFELTAEVVDWEVEPGVRREAWTYNGVTPGPEIRVNQGDRIRIILTNNLTESTTIHPHGQHVRNEEDGVAFLTNDVIKPGTTGIVEFDAATTGSHMYHSHHNSAKQVARGLLGPLIVEPPAREDLYPPFDREYTIVLNDGPLGYTFNGKGFPATQPLRAELGDRVLIRWMHEGAIAHPIHIHGLNYEIVGRDGYPLPAPWRADTINIAPGERWETIVEAKNPGKWLIHCHILPHAEGEHGLYGMAAVMIIDGDDGKGGGED